jgi:hypothetical protein
MREKGRNELRRMDNPQAPFQQTNEFDALLTETLPTVYEIRVGVCKTMIYAMIELRYTD